MMTDAQKLITLQVIAELAAKRLVRFLPFLALPGVHGLLLYALVRVGELLFEELSRVFVFNLIDSRTTAERLAYEAASDALVRAQVDGKDLDAAKAQFRATLRHLVSMRPAP